MSSEAPKVTFALPVKNGQKFIGRAIDSLLAQSFGDFEIVISDNGSTDATPTICRDYQQRDPRIRYHQNERDIGILRNFNQLVGMGRGTYFRWLGSDDWLDPEYAAKCTALLDANPQCIAVSTYQTHTDDAGERFYREYDGPRVDSDQPHQRFARMLWFMKQEHWLLDPNFSMFRREALARTSLHRMMTRNDRILAAELSLLGPWGHVPRCLSHRRKTEETAEDVDRKIRPPDATEFGTSISGRFAALLSVIREARLPAHQAAYCRAAALSYYLWDLREESVLAIVDFRRRMGLTRSLLRRLTLRGSDSE